jgi:hypothetical protein
MRHPRPDRILALLLVAAITVAASSACGDRMEAADFDFAESKVMELFMHAMIDGTGNRVDPIDEHGIQANLLWQGQCDIEMRWTTNEDVVGPPVDTVGVDSAKFQIKLGEEFFYDEPALDPDYVRNWRMLQVRQVHFLRNRFGRDEGGDAFYSRDVHRAGDYGVAAATLLTPPVWENLSVVEPLFAGNFDYILAHEIGHQLGLPDRPDTVQQGKWLMYPTVGGIGPQLSGGPVVGGPEPPISTECGLARQDCESRGFCLSTF